MVNFIAASSTVLGNQHITRCRVDDDALDIAMPEAVDFWRSAVLMHEGVIRRHPALAVQPDHCAQVIRGVLCLLAPRTAVSQGEQ
ncbi:hypothetical protein D3C78_761890 [compost metagenome]